MLSRAGAMSYGGCHEFSNGAALGNGKKWPQSAGFVHIDEAGHLSAALDQFFVPRRVAILRKFHCDQTPMPETPCPGAPAAAAAVAGPGLPALLEAVAERRSAYLNALAAHGAAAAPRGAEALARELSDAVEAARAAEQALPGAFASQRRTH